MRPPMHAFASAGFVLLAAAAALAPLVLVPGDDPRPVSIEAEAFRVLPWSRLVRTPDADGSMRVRLQRPTRGVRVRVLGTSCGCARASVEASGVLTVVLASGRAPPARVRVRLGVERGAARATRTLDLEPRRCRGRRTPIVVEHDVPPDDPTRAGALHARIRLRDREPPRLRTTAPLHALVHPMDGGGHEVLVFGHASTQAVRDAGVLVTESGPVPLRIFRAGRAR